MIQKGRFGFLSVYRPLGFRYPARIGRETARKTACLSFVRLSSVGSTFAHSSFGYSGFARRNSFCLGFGYWTADYSRVIEQIAGCRFYLRQTVFLPSPFPLGLIPDFLGLPHPVVPLPVRRMADPLYLDRDESL